LITRGEEPGAAAAPDSGARAGEAGAAAGAGDEVRVLPVEDGAPTDELPESPDETARPEPESNCGREAKPGEEEGRRSGGNADGGTTRGGGAPPAAGRGVPGETVRGGALTRAVLFASPGLRVTAVVPPPVLRTSRGGV